MQQPPDIDRSALQIAERLIQLLDRGGFTATYKYAVLVALIDLCLERTDSNELPPSSVTTRQLAEKIVELYWPHCEPYMHAEKPRILHQSSGGGDKPVLIVRDILDFREAADPSRQRSLSLVRARHMAPQGHYESLIRRVEWTLIHMPLPRLQRIGREEDRFLYEYNFTEDTPYGDVARYQRGEGKAFDNVLKLKPGVETALLSLNSLLRPLIYRAWTQKIARMNKLKESQLEEFLFGAKRISLEPIQAALVDLQHGLCFYCEGELLKTCQVDHFMPWARHADNSIDNLVAAHGKCNGHKSDFLAGADHVVRWRQRSVRDERALAEIARAHDWESAPKRSLSVTRALYGMLPDGAHLWRMGKDFEVIDRARIVSALAA